MTSGNIDHIFTLVCKKDLDIVTLGGERGPAGEENATLKYVRRWSVLLVMQRHTNLDAARTASCLKALLLFNEKRSCDSGSFRKA
jgi:hypothetical protein